MAIKLKPREIRWQFWIGLSFCLLVMIGTIVGSSWLYYRLMDANEVPLRRLAVQGAVQTVTANEVRAALKSGELGSFFSADVDELRRRVEALPWVDRASIRKEWPDILQVYVVEQQPLAYWNDTQLINQRGEVFDADLSRLAREVSDNLPFLYGPPNAVAETQEQFQRLKGLLELNGFKVRALRLSERFATELVLASGIELRLGREARVERVQRFIDMYPAIEKQQQGPIDYVDLRYDTGVAISWRE